MGKVFGRGFITNGEKSEEAEGVSDEALSKIFQALEAAHQANEIDLYSINLEEFTNIARRAFVAQTEEPTRQLALVEDATGERAVSVTDDMSEPARWALQDDGHFATWDSLVQPVLVITHGVSVETLAKWEAKAKAKAEGDAESLAKFEKGEGFVEDPTRSQPPTFAPASVPVEHRADGRDL